MWHVGRGMSLPHKPSHYAYAETKAFVYQEIEQKLPRELTDMVLEYNLVAEEIPEKSGMHEETFIKCGSDAYIFHDTESEGSSLCKTDSDERATLRNIDLWKY
jgi:hypothetical protein